MWREAVPCFSPSLVGCKNNGRGQFEQRLVNNIGISPSTKTTPKMTFTAHARYLVNAEIESRISILDDAYESGPTERDRRIGQVLCLDRDFGMGTGGVNAERAAGDPGC